MWKFMKYALLPAAAIALAVVAQPVLTGLDSAVARHDESQVQCNNGVHRR